MRSSATAFGGITGFRRGRPLWNCTGEPERRYMSHPVASDEVCVVVISRDSKLRLQEALSDFPEVSSRLMGVAPASTEMGALSVSRSLKSVRRKNVVLIGDASGSVDAITGEGICVSVKQAHALAVAVENGNLELYQQLHLKLMRRPQTMASLMLTLQRNAHLQRRALAGLAQASRYLQIPARRSRRSVLFP